MRLSGADCAAAVVAMRTAVEADRARLTALDAALGDGDHGVNLARALGAAETAVQALVDPAPTDVWRAVGATLVEAMGGASGAIFGSFFRGGARAVKEADAMTLADVRAFLAAGLAAVQKRGRAAPGDKTLVDALAPALAALDTAAVDDQPLPDALAAAASAAERGAAGTRDMVAAFGRAKFLGERSRGHQDAGATSLAVMLRAWANVVAAKREEIP